MCVHKNDPVVVNLNVIYMNYLTHGGRIPIRLDTLYTNLFEHIHHNPSCDTNLAIISMIEIDIIIVCNSILTISIYK